LAISDTIFTFARNVMIQANYAGIFLLMAMESATLPIPSEVVLPFAGFLVYQRVLEFWTAVVAATLGSLVGTMVDYGIGYRFGRRAILRYGRFVRLSEKHLKSSETWFAKHGDSAALFARFVPLLRTVIAFPAGIAKMRVGKFLAFSTVGILIWDIALIYVGMAAGQNATLIVNTLQSAFVVVELVAVGVTLLVLVLVSKRHKKS
jgi:membrane protein DedA with SNARE-associated domain